MIEGKIFSNHVRWCQSNPAPAFSKTGLENIAKSNRQYIEQRLGPIRPFEVKCSKCQTKFVTLERLKQFPKKSKYYCSISCAKSRGPRSEEFKKRVRKKLQKYGLEACKYCDEKFKKKNQRHKFCSRKCAGKNRFKHVDKKSLSYYRQLCSFKFSIKNYPQEFNSDLIKEHGWYSASNRDNNMDGVSRDHMVSVKYGFQNNIDPRIIKHPANCRLILQKNNASKGMNCEITLDTLINKITIWNKKYGTEAIVVNASG